MAQRNITEFRKDREIGQRRVLDSDHLGIKRFFGLDTNTYRDAALKGKTKELLGLVASLVLRCDDCVDYHLEQCVKYGYTEAELMDALNVGLIVGGSIVISHLRHARLSLDELLKERDAGDLEMIAG